MDVLFIIKSYHTELQQALSKVYTADGLKTRRTLTDELERDLHAYLILERDYLYPEIVDQFPGADALVTIGLANLSVIEKRAKALQKHLAKSANEQDGLEKRTEELKDALEAHFDHEERVLMPKLRSSMRTEDREDLGQVIVEAGEDLRSDGGERKMPPPQAAPSGRKRA